MIEIEVLSAALVTLLAYVACVGWGGLVRRCVHLQPPADPGLTAGWGMAFSAVFGGALSLLGAAGTVIVRAYGIGGIVLATYWIYRRWRELPVGSSWRPPTAGVSILIVVVGLAILLRLLAAASHELNAHDDYHAYLVFPIRMLETGSLGDEPFNERRLLALGGQSFLHAFQLAWVPWRYANTTDLGLGWLVLVGLVAGQLFQRRVSPIAALGMLLALQWERPPVVNLSSTLTGAALQYALVRTWFLAPAESQSPRLWLLALTIAGLCSLKSSLLVGCVAALLALWLATRRPDRWRRLAELSLATLFAALLLVPWALQLHESSGTWFYPLLGAGFHGSTQGDFPGVSDSIQASGIGRGVPEFLIRSRPLLAIGIICLLTPLLLRAKPHRHRHLVLLWGASWSAAVVIFVQSGGLGRYSYSLVIATTLFVLAECLPPFDGGRAASRRWQVATAALLALFATIQWSRGSSPFVLLGAAAGREPETQRSDYLNAQMAVPNASEILACAAYPFLLDFRRNPIYTIDHAGGASPPPGMPVMGTNEQLLTYLRGKRIRYVLYSHADEAHYGRNAVGDRLSLSGGFYRDRVRKLAEYNIAFRDRLTELARRGAEQFNNGRILVLDLQSPTVNR